jgi:amino acid transporter
LNAAPGPQLRRTIGLWDLVLFNLTAVIGLRWIATAAKTGPYSLTLWALALLLFFIPQGLAVVALATRFPEEGGIYDWTKRAFGPAHGFFCGWCYWVSNLSYIPTLLISGLASGVYLGGPDALPLAKNNTFVFGLSLALLAGVVALNVTGTEKGKWLQNLGGISNWIPGTLLVILGLITYVRLGPANDFSAAALRPRLEMGTLSFWAVQAFAFAGLELAPIMSGEIRDPRRNVPLAVVISGVLIAAIYILGTASVLVAVPSSAVDILAGPVQAIDATARREGIGSLSGAVGLLIALASLGGAGAWLAGSSRIPFVAGLDRHLPPSFASIHPRWLTPHVAILTQAGCAAALLVLGLPGGTVAEAYLFLQDLTILLYFGPFLYMFAALALLARAPAPAGAIPIPGGRAGTIAVSAVGCCTTLVALALSLVPPAEAVRPWLYQLKLIGGAAVFFALGLWLYRAYSPHRYPGRS